VSLIISFYDLNVWIRLILIIFLIGGLIVSFTYIVRLIPNNINKKMLPLFISVRLIVWNSRCNEIFSASEGKIFS